jgi:hypothetical protein
MLLDSWPIFANEKLEKDKVRISELTFLSENDVFGKPGYGFTANRNVFCLIS